MRENIFQEEAIEILNNNGQVIGTERIALDNSIDRILAEDIIADRDDPPFDRSLRDGYACLKNDIPGTLEIIEIIKAGEFPKKKIILGKCAKIMTGAIVPEGSNCIVMVEFSKKIDSDYVKLNPPNRANFISPRGEYKKKGDVIVEKGTIIDTGIVSIMAYVGKSNPLVYERPKIGIIATGDELVEVHEKPAECQIRNCNSSLLKAQLKEIGCDTSYLGIANDDLELLTQKIRKEKDIFDIILISGGVSAGDYDFVLQAIKDSGYEIVFHKINIRPGKPAVFARVSNSYIYGVPGNPISGYLNFELFIKPFIYNIMGHKYNPEIIEMEITDSIKNKMIKRDCWYPVNILNNNQVKPVYFKGAAHLSSLVETDGIVCIPRGKKEIKKGEKVDVRRI